MVNRLPIALVVVALTAFGEMPGATANVINVTANRHVDVGDITGSFAGANSPSTALGSFSDSVTQTLGVTSAPPGEQVTAQQNTNIQAGTGQFSGNGSGQIGFSVIDADTVFADSFFDVFFEITLPHSYSLTGSLDTNVDGGLGVANFSLSGPTTLGFAAVNNGPVSLNSSGLLLPGIYVLKVEARMDNGGSTSPDSFMGGSATFDFNLSLTEEVPEPATLAIFGLGLAGLGLIRRRRTQ